MYTLKSTLTLIALFMASMCVAQQSALDRITESGKMRLGVSGNQPPYSLISKSDELIGFEVDLATALTSAMQVELELIQLPFSELIPGLESGKVDAVMSGMTITAQRNMEVMFVGPYNVSGKTVLTKSATLSRLDSEEEAGTLNASVVVLAGSTSEQYARSYFPNATIVPTPNYDDAVQMVLNDEVDALLADVEICQVSILKFPDKDLAMLNQPLTIEPIGVAVPGSDYRLANLIDNYFNQLELMGIMEKLRAKWFQDGTWLLQAK